MTVARSLADVLPPQAFTGPVGGPEAVDPRKLRADQGVGARRPESVVCPASEEETAAVMKWASEEGVGVLPMWSGGGVEAVRDDRPYIALSTQRLAGIQTYEPADLTVTAGAGTPFAAIEDALRSHGQWVPLDPPFVTRRSLGGLVAAGESGPLWTGYGALRNHVLGATVISGDGRKLSLGGRVVKNVAGFDLLKAVVGSRGTLGIVTSVCIRAFPEPVVDRVLVAHGDELTDLLESALRVGTAPILPASTVLVDRLEGSNGDGRAALIVRLHGALATVDADAASLQSHVGADFEILSEDRHAAVLEVTRDRAADAPMVVTLSVRPSRLGGLLAGLAPLEPAGVVIDSYGGGVRVGLTDFDGPALAKVWAEVQRLDGAMRIRGSVPDAAFQEGAPGAAVISVAEPSERIAKLKDRIRAAFDPAGVLWPARS